MNEIFGEENFVSEIIWQKKTGASDAKAIAAVTEYIIVFCKNKEKGLMSFSKNIFSYDLERYKYKDEHILTRGVYYIDNLDRGGLQYSEVPEFCNRVS
ncbi:hypothetical protein ATZ36_05195 [Candidatus Endomicrobiellum trichonymphae]|uniref:DNA methylase N-4/N-6 domain-containing protein n=1 Tax=Endomicrobium trichonymphae TaxID=1408204 RepID=A0A1E5IIM7_ENDTX|nr:hypothetical protein ATZ36_05195 [Candidatus Endomicrobium trichonymphae]